MKNPKLRFVFLICHIAIFCIFINRGLFGQSLAEIYKTGKIKFVPDKTIIDDNMFGKDYFGLPVSAILDDEKSIIVCDYKANNLKKFDASGKYLGTIGRPGQGPGEFSGPVELKFSNGKLYVREGMNSRVTILSPAGEFIKSVRIDPQKGSWQIMRSLPDGRFIVQKQIVHRENVNAPQDLILDLYSKDIEYIRTIYQHKVRLDKYVIEPRYTNMPIPFAPSVYWDIDSKGKIILGCSEKYEIECYDPDKGKISTIIHTYAPVEVTSIDKEHFFESITVMGFSGQGGRTSKRGASASITENTDFPKAFPPYRALRVDPEDNIWVVLWRSQAQKERSVFDAFEADGTYINRVSIENNEPVPFRPFWLPDGFWSIKTSNEGDYQIVRCRITRSSQLK